MNQDLEITINYMPYIKGLVGKSKEVITIKSGSSLADLLDLIINKYSSDVLNESYFATLNDYDKKTYSYDNAKGLLLKDKDEFTIIPSICGG